jgi:glycosyltransferase involved in cell wall biosynthesis
MRANRPRLALLGPMTPFRGGIARHTSRLRAALAERSELLSLSFTRQYPRVLFPGESDREPGREGLVEPQTEYLVDSVNPLTWRAAVRRIALDKPDALVLPWWTFFFGPCFGFIAQRLRAHGIPTVFFCHNVSDHEASLHKRLVSKYTLGLGAGFAVHTEAEAEKLRALFGDVPIVVHAHPIYDEFPAPTETLERRAPLELLFFGLVRPYKGLDVLLEALALSGRRDVHLSVVGEFWQDRSVTDAELARLGIADLVELVPRFVSDKEAASYFTRADAVVLPYRSATGSGVVPLAYHYEKPVIVTRVGGLPDVVLEGKTGHLVEPGNAGALADVLRNLKRENMEALRPGIQTFKRTLSWDSMAEQLVALVGEVRSRTEPGRAIK